MSEVVQCQQWSAFQTLEFRPKIHVRVATGTWPWLLVISGDFYGIIHSNSINGVSSVLITGKRATTAGTRVFLGYGMFVLKRHAAFVLFFFRTCGRSKFYSDDYDYGLL